MPLDQLTKRQREKLCRIFQQGMVQTAEMLSRLLRQPVDVEVSDVWMSGCRLSDSFASTSHLGVYMQVSGDINGGLLLALSEDCAGWLSDRLLGGVSSGDLLAEPASSTLKEVGNILASSFLASLDDQLGLRAMPSPPRLSCVPLDKLLQMCQQCCDEACLIVRTRLLGSGDASGNLQGAVYLFPEPAALEMLLAKIDGA